MSRSAFWVLAGVAMACAGCAPLGTTSGSSGASPAASGPERLVFADFGRPGKSTNQGAEVITVSYSERRGDAFVTDMGVEGSVVKLKATVGNTRGSQWGGAGVVIGRNGHMEPIDLTSYSQLRIRLASPTAKALRVRIAGMDDKIVNIGCYPVVVQAVTATPQDYTIALSRFQPESYCGDNARRIKDTLPAARSVEVVDNAITNQPTEFSVGTVEFLR